MNARTSPSPDPGAFERGLHRAPVAVALEVDVKAPPVRVWELLCRVERWTAWHPGIDMAVLRGETPARGVHLDWRADGMRIRSVVMEAVEPGVEGGAGGPGAGRLEWTLQMMGASGAQRWTILPLPDGRTSVRLEEWWTGLTPRLLRGTLQRTLDVARDAWLDRLRQRAERPGERVPAP